MIYNMYIIGASATVLQKHIKHECLYACIPGDFMSATQKSWRGLGSKAMTCCHEASAKKAVMRRSLVEEEKAIVCISFG